jgi:hypothetical protein
MKAGTVVVPRPGYRADPGKLSHYSDRHSRNRARRTATRWAGRGLEARQRRRCPFPAVSGDDRARSPANAPGVGRRRGPGHAENPGGSPGAQRFAIRPPRLTRPSHRSRRDLTCAAARLTPQPCGPRVEDEGGDARRGLVGAVTPYHITAVRDAAVAAERRRRRGDRGWRGGQAARGGVHTVSRCRESAVPLVEPCARKRALVSRSGDATRAGRRARATVASQNSGA